MVAAKIGGPDPDSNPRLRMAVDKAKSNSMPKANIERAIAKGSGELEGADYENLVYEGYGPGGVAVLVECLTDNRNRTSSEVRHAFTKHGGNLGTSGSVAYLFSQKSVFTLPGEAVDEDTLMMAALDGGADDIELVDGEWQITAAFEGYATCREALEELGVGEVKGETTRLPDTQVEVSTDDAAKLFKLLARLEDLDDVQDTYTNADFDEAALEAALD